MASSAKTHCKFLLLSQLIVVCKDRKKLVNTSGKVGKRRFEEMGARSAFSFEAMEGDQDHRHGLVKSEPRISPLASVRPGTARIPFSALEKL